MGNLATRVRVVSCGMLPVLAVRVDQGAVLVSLAGPAAWSYGVRVRVSSCGQKADVGRQVARLACGRLVGAR